MRLLEWVGLEASEVRAVYETAAVAARHLVYFRSKDAVFQPGRRVVIAKLGAGEGGGMLDRR